MVAVSHRLSRAQRSMPCAAGHHDSLAEWSKALAQGASPQGRGFEPHSCHFPSRGNAGLGAQPDMRTCGDIPRELRIHAWAMATRAANVSCPRVRLLFAPSWLRHNKPGCSCWLSRGGQPWSRANRGPSSSLSSPKKLPSAGCFPLGGSLHFAVFLARRGRGARVAHGRARSREQGAAGAKKKQAALPPPPRGRSPSRSAGDRTCSSPPPQPPICATGAHQRNYTAIAATTTTQHHARTTQDTHAPRRQRTTTTTTTTTTRMTRDTAGDDNGDGRTLEVA